MKSLIFSRKKRLCVPWEYHLCTITVPRFKNKNKKSVHHGCVQYEYHTSTSTRGVPGADTFCKLEYPCFRRCDCREDLWEFLWCSFSISFWGKAKNCFLGGELWLVGKLKFIYQICASVYFVWEFSEVFVLNLIIGLTFRIREDLSDLEK